MKEFVAKKLGEVLAFSRVGAETMERGSDAYKSVFGDSFATLSERNYAHGSEIERAASAAGMTETVMKKLESTSGKLQAMRDIYLADKDDWKNPSEILEWMGFFEGAALVHWKLVLGAAEVMESNDLRNLASEAVSYHETLLLEAGSKLAEIGEMHSKE